MDTNRSEITIGYRIGKLTIEGKTGRKRNGYTVWICRCDCGGMIELDTRYLRRGTVKDCGCQTTVKPGMLDLEGKRFGRLVCVQPSDVKDHNGNTQWVCQCDCGNTCLAAVHQLRAGYKKSCGCLSHPPLKNYVGERFFLLTVLEYAGKKDGQHYWRCRCDCGNETVVRQTLLQSGKTKSCGCLQKTQIVRNMRLFEGTSVTALETRMTKNPISSNTSGYNGVYRNKRTGKWAAQITLKGNTHFLGSFESIQDAVQARRQAEDALLAPIIKWYYTAFGEDIVPARESPGL